ncbi:MAG: hypothetical protein AAF191_05190, partial [Verrucomicrobiota bacterium]
MPFSKSPLIFAVILTSLLPHLAHAQFSSYWNWNHQGGSDVVGLKASGTTRTFVMLKNHSGIGCPNGAVVFSGTKNGNQYQGVLLGQSLKGVVSSKGLSI